MIKPKKFIEKIPTRQTNSKQTDWRLKLDLNENIYGVSDVVFNNAKILNKEDISFYPSCEKLLAKLAKKYETEQNNILLTNGSSEAIKLIVDTYVENDDEILSFNPIKSDAFIFSTANGAKLNLIDYDEMFVFDKNKIIDNISPKTKLIYIDSPDSFSGNIVKPSTIEVLAENTADVLIVVDCSYINFAENTNMQDYIDLEKKYDNIALIKSFSYDYALAGMRMGCIVANSEIIKNIKKIVPLYNINSLGINCVVTALNDEKRLNEITDLNIQAKNLLSKGIEEIGYKVYPSQANFVLCDFGKYCNFYYEKFKKNGIIVKNFPQDSVVSNCLQITIPKIGGVKYILELVKVKDVLIFDIDGVIFDVSNSYMSAISECFKYFSGIEIDKSEIYRTKTLSGMNCDWDAVDYLLKKYNYNIEMSEIISVFQNLFFNPNDKTGNNKYLIDEEKLLISKEIFEKLLEKYDLVVFSGRFRDEINHSFEKFGIGKYFYYFVSSDDLPKNMLKPHPRGVLEILEHCPHKSIRYLGDSVDDIISGNNANVETIGVISPDCDKNTMINNFKHLGATYILEDITKLVGFLDEIN